MNKTIPQDLQELLFNNTKDYIIFINNSYTKISNDKRKDAFFKHNLKAYVSNLENLTEEDLSLIELIEKKMNFKSDFFLKKNILDYIDIKTIKDFSEAKILKACFIM